MASVTKLKHSEKFMLKHVHPSLSALIFLSPSLSPLPWWRAVRMWSMRVLTEEDIARTKIHGHKLTPSIGFNGHVHDSLKLFPARGSRMVEGITTSKAASLLLSRVDQVRQRSSRGKLCMLLNTDWCYFEVWYLFVCGLWGERRSKCVYKRLWKGLNLYLMLQTCSHTHTHSGRSNSVWKVTLEQRRWGSDCFHWKTRIW